MARQSGHIFKKGDSWFLRYRDAEKQRCNKLDDVCGCYRREKDVQALVSRFLAPLNAGKVRPESYLSVSDFAGSHCLTWARANCKPSTVSGYQAFRKHYLGPHIPKMSPRDFHSVDACTLFAEIYRQHTGRIAFNVARLLQPEPWRRDYARKPHDRRYSVEGSFAPDEHCDNRAELR
jgi:hypothetical protein